MNKTNDKLKQAAKNLNDWLVVQIGWRNLNCVGHDEKDKLFVYLSNNKCVNQIPTEFEGFEIEVIIQGNIQPI